MPGGVVRIVCRFDRKIAPALGMDFDRIPVDGGCRVFFSGEKNAARIDRQDVGVRIPLGDEALGERDVDGDGCLLRRVEIKNRSFHADGAAQATLEVAVLEMLDKRGEAA